MITVGLLPSKELISLNKSEDREFIDAPEGQTIISLIKLPQPEITAAQKATPYLEWFNDRVERRWMIADKTAEELAIQSRKIWSTVADFWGEFSNTEKLAIADSKIPDIRLLHEELRMWRGEVWSDDPKVQQGLAGLVTVGILTESQKTQILTK